MRFREVARLDFEDRVVQRALLTWLQRNVPAPPPVVCAYVPGRGAHPVIDWMHRALRAGSWCGGLDVVDFFPSIDRGRLMPSVSRHVRLASRRSTGVFISPSEAVAHIRGASCRERS